MKKRKTIRTKALIGLLQEILYAFLLMGVGSIIALNFAR